MSRRKRKRKPTRRQRQAGIDRPAKRPEDVAADTSGSDPAEASKQVAQDAPGPGPGRDQAPAQPSGPPATVSATFTPTTKSESAVTLEQRYVTGDLRRLGIQTAAFAVVLAGLAVLQAQTDLVGDLGAWLFRWWG